MKEILVTEKDIPELLNVQKTAFMPVSLKLNWPDAANITETLEQATEAFPHYTMLKMLNDEGRIIGMVRGKVENGSLYIGKLMVLPEYQGTRHRHSTHPCHRETTATSKGMAQHLRAT